MYVGGEVDLAIEGRPGSGEEVGLGQVGVGAGGACLGVAALEPKDGLWDFGLGGGREAAAAGAHAGVVAGVCAIVFEGFSIMFEKEVEEGFSLRGMSPGRSMVRVGRTRSSGRGASLPW